MGINAFVETQLRYHYKRYGEDIFVDSALIRLVNLDGGQIIWTGSYEGNKNKLQKVKYDYVTDLLNQLKRFK